MLRATENSSTSLRGSWRAVEPDELPAAWPRYAPLVRQALESGEGSYAERDVLLALLAGQWGLYAVEREAMATAICITQIVDFPRQRKFLVRYVAGDGDSMIEALPALEHVARAAGCQVIEAYGRKGWARKLPDWSGKYVILQKEL